MQTFLPFPDFQKCAEVLDYRRLGKQRVECLQILNALRNGGGWSSHPATKMWRGYEESLEDYQTVMIQEWLKRGYKNNMQFVVRDTPAPTPPWLGREDVHASHRAALLYKAPDWYSQWDWQECPVLDYVWPCE